MSQLNADSDSNDGNHEAPPAQLQLSNIQPNPNSPREEAIPESQPMQHYSGYSSPPLACFILLTFSLIVLSFFFLGAAFQQKAFLASSQYYLRNISFKMFHLADEIADMKLSLSQISWQLISPDGTVQTSSQPPVLVNNSWNLGTVNIPYKVSAPGSYELRLIYDGQQTSYLLGVVEQNGSFYVQKPVYIAFLATPSGQQKLSPARPRYVDEFIGYSPISIRIFSTEAPEVAYLDYGYGGSVSEFSLFIALLVVGVVLTVMLGMFAVYALQITDVSAGFVVNTSGGQLLRKYDEPQEIRENQRIPLYG